MIGALLAPRSFAPPPFLVRLLAVHVPAFSDPSCPPSLLAPQAMSILKAKHPEVPVIYFANGGSSYLEKQDDMVHRGERAAFRDAQA